MFLFLEYIVVKYIHTTSVVPTAGSVCFLFLEYIVVKYIQSTSVVPTADTVLLFLE